MRYNKMKAIDEVYQALLNTCNITEEASVYLKQLLSSEPVIIDNTAYDIILFFDGYSLNEENQSKVIKACDYNKIYQAYNDPANNLIECCIIEIVNDESTALTHYSSSVSFEYDNNSEKFTISIAGLGSMWCTVDKNNNYTIYTNHGVIVWP